MLTIKKVLKINILKTIYYNFLCKKVERSKKAFLYVYKHAKIKICKRGKLILKKGAKLELGIYSNFDARGFTTLIIHESASITVLDYLKMYSGSTIIAHNGSTIEINGANMNNGSLIRSGLHIKIGRCCSFGARTSIFDSDFHDVIYLNNKINENKSVEIGNNVWTGINVTILKGTNIGNDCIIGACTLVSNKKIPNGTLLYNLNTAIQKSNYSWK